MRKRLGRRAVIAPAVVVVAVGSSGFAWAASGNGSTPYRTASVSLGDVEQTLTLVGTTKIVSQAAAAFPVSGTIATVDVRVGEIVTKGQTLATIKTQTLTAGVVAANASLAKAKAALETAQTTTASATTSSSTRTTSSTVPVTPTASVGLASGSKPISRVTSGASRTLSTESQDLRSATKALALASSMCATTSLSPSPSPTSTPSPVTSPSPTPVPTPTLAGASRPVLVPASPAAPTRNQPNPLPGTSSCLAALEASLAAQVKVAQDQANANTVLQGMLASLSSASSTTGSSTAANSTAATSRGASANSASSSTAGSGGGGAGGTSSQSTAAQIITDTAAITAAQVALDKANANLDGASLKSPLAGIVAAMPFVPGQSETPTQSITVVAPGSVEVTVNVPYASIRSAKVGAAATVTADGATTGVTGVVSRIGLLPISSTSTVSYPVTVLVPRAGNAFTSGGAASVSIVLKKVTGVVTVPNSALRNGSVMVLAGGKAVSTRVQTGAVGALMTEVTSGLKAGQLVVLADLRTAVPANSTTTTRGFGGGGGLGGNPPGGISVVGPGGGGGFTGRAG